VEPAKKRKDKHQKPPKSGWYARTKRRENPSERGRRGFNPQRARTDGLDKTGLETAEKRSGARLCYAATRPVRACAYKCGGGGGGWRTRERKSEVYRRREDTQKRQRLPRKKRKERKKAAAPTGMGPDNHLCYRYGGAGEGGGGGGARKNLKKRPAVLRRRSVSL